ncbi:MAG TPA: shikimate dehydrogenase [Chitinispirillaceae bacterium]|nr:shikimate dehydrogenase [Chitinispirillaceae bacterium]
MSMHSFIKGSSRLTALLGYPVSHSISPQIHNHVFERLNLPFVYIPFPVPPRGLHTAIHALRNSNFAGANVTIPHKSAVVPYCDVLSDLSRATGTVNTLYLENGLLCGTTTDHLGFIRSIEKMGTTLNNSHLVLLGNGGTARTLSIALALEKPVASITIAGRNSLKVKSLADEVYQVTGVKADSVSFDDERLESVLNRCSILVNCTNVGMHPDIDSTPLPKKYFRPEMTVFDAIYNPLETRFLREAREAGCKTLNGLLMLLYQGLAASKYWTGIEVPEDLFSTHELEKLIIRN